MSFFKKLFDSIVAGGESSVLDTVTSLAQGRQAFDAFEYEKALQYYLESYPSYANNPALLTGMADCYQKLNLHMIAKDYYQQALEYDASYLAAHVGLCCQYIIDGEYDHAKKNFENIQTLRSQLSFHDELVDASIQRLDDALSHLQDA